MQHHDVIAGIFVGGSSTRMGLPKGLIVHEGVTLVERAVTTARSCGLRAVLVGDRADYAHLDLDTLRDTTDDHGPAAGLASLLAYASARTARGRVVAIACDMPYVHAGMVRALLETHPEAACVAPRREGRWEPFFARYDAEQVAPLLHARLSRGERALQGLLDEANATELMFGATDLACLGDWDVPSDVGA